MTIPCSVHLTLYNDVRSQNKVKSWLAYVNVEPITDLRVYVTARIWLNGVLN